MTIYREGYTLLITEIWGFFIGADKNFFFPSSWDTKLTEEPGELQAVSQEAMNILSYSDMLWEQIFM